MAIASNGSMKLTMTMLKTMRLAGKSKMAKANPAMPLTIIPAIIVVTATSSVLAMMVPNPLAKTSI